mgnify:CR=1 FL=1
MHEPHIKKYKNITMQNYMQISNERINKFKELWKKRFNEKISDNFAYEQITDLATMIKLIYKPIKKSDLKESYQ